MVESLEKVLEKIVVKKYPEIDYVVVSQIGLGGFYRVKYYSQEIIDKQVKLDIMNDTVDLYKMVGPDRNGDIFIEFGISEED